MKEFAELIAQQAAYDTLAEKNPVLLNTVHDLVIRLHQTPRQVYQAVNYKSHSIALIVEQAAEYIQNTEEPK